MLWDQKFRLITGQSLIELVIALGVGVAMMGVATAGLFLSLKSGQFAQQNQVAAVSIEALSDLVTPFAEQNWNNIYAVPGKNPSNHYYIATSTGQLVRVSGDQQLSIGNINYTRYFYVENVSRDPGSDNIESVYNSNNDDPSTQKITFVSSWTSGGSNGNIVSAVYLTRWPNQVLVQSDWSGGPGQTGPIIAPNNKFDDSDGVNYSATPGSLLPGSASCDGCELISSVFDTGVSGGAAFNTVMWQGTQTSGRVKFKFSFSNCPNGANNPPTCNSGNWNWAGQPAGPPGPGVQNILNRTLGNNKRYFKYKILIDSNNLTSPKIDDIIVSWSR